MRENLENGFVISDSYSIYYTDFSLGNKINFIEKFNFQADNWSCEIYLSESDRRKLGGRKKIKISTLNRLEELKANFNGVIMGGDIATVESTIGFFKNDTLQFVSGLIIEDSYCGLQNNLSGFIEFIDSDAIKKILK